MALFPTSVVALLDSWGVTSNQLGQQEVELLTQILACQTVSAGGPSGVLPVANGGTGQTSIDGIVTEEATNPLLFNTIWVAVKNVTVGTAGSPADIANIVLPAGITRWSMAITGKAVAETASGTLAAAQFVIRDASGGGGLGMSTTASGPASAGAGTNLSPALAAQISTSTTVFIRQTIDSANAGTMSFYIPITPLL